MSACDYVRLRSVANGGGGGGGCHTDVRRVCVWHRVVPLGG